MSLLKAPPTLDHLSRAYYELSLAGARAVGANKKWPYKPASLEALLCLAAEMSRYDPRLLGILVEWVVLRRHDFNPLKIRQGMKEMQTPQTLGVIFLLAQGVCAEQEFAYFVQYLTRGLGPVAPQLYFKALYPPASNLMLETAAKPIHEFQKWGFMARERPVIHGTGRTQIGRWGPKTRQNIIKELAREKGRFAVSEYLEAVDHTISRQQALVDLKNSGWVRPRGKGRGSFWVKR